MKSVKAKLAYTTLERLTVRKPVDRIDYIAELCRGKRVLDLGALDETALLKRDTTHWLHGRLSQVAAEVIGIDCSEGLLAHGLPTGPNSRIYKGDATDPQLPGHRDEEIEVIVAGEFIEHIESPLAFLQTMKRRFQSASLRSSSECSRYCRSVTCLGFACESEAHLQSMDCRNMPRSLKAASGLETIDRIRIGLMLEPSLARSMHKSEAERRTAF
jgi:2-polyprenyl-3-methyl-5-hydroxy-6-metoxy-1,4-benzoquinol methylase